MKKIIIPIMLFGITGCVLVDQPLVGGFYLAKSDFNPTTPFIAYDHVLATSNKDDTLAGVDSDHNGIRDDIDAYIVSKPIPELEQIILLKEAAVMQDEVLFNNHNNSKMLKELFDKENQINDCMFSVFSEKYDNLHDKFDWVRKLSRYTFNTSKRFDKMNLYDRAVLKEYSAGRINFSSNDLGQCDLDVLLKTKTLKFNRIYKDIPSLYQKNK